MSDLAIYYLVFAHGIMSFLVFAVSSIRDMKLYGKSRKTSAILDENFGLLMAFIVLGSILIPIFISVRVYDGFCLGIDKIRGL